MRVKGFVAPMVVGVVVAAAFGLWLSATRHTATPDVVEGWATPNVSGTAIGLQDSDDTRGGTSYIIAGAFWAGRDEVWHEGSYEPTCVGTDTDAKIHVQLGIVDVEPDGEGIGGPRVVWLRCLD